MAETNLPKQVQAQLEEAAAIEAQLKGNTQQAVTTEPVVEATPPQDPAPTPAAEPTPAPEVDWEAKFKQVDGRYRNDVPKLTKAVQAATAEIEALKAQLSSIAEKQNEKPDDPLVSKKDEETFGADLIDLARRVVKEEISQVLKRLNTVERALANVAAMPEKIKQIEETTAEEATRRFWADVEKAEPTWKQIDVDPRWIEFLETRAKGSVKSYRESAVEAISTGNVEALLEVIDIFKDVAGIKAQEKKDTQKKRELESQTQPGTTKATGTQSTPSTEANRFWTWEEYEYVHSPKANRENTPEQVASLQAAAEKAYLEGRVR